MIRFRIVGSGYLELPADFDFTFNYNNGIFAFDKMQLSRSGEFIIPRTPANDLLLGFSHDPSNDGNYIRKSKSAELHYSGGKIDGYLFIGKFTAGSGYSAVFIYGELAGLKRIQELGTIDEYMSANYSLSVDEPLINSYYPSGLFPFESRFWRYQNGIPDASKFVTHFNQFPTVRLSYLLTQAATAAGVTIDTTALGTAKDALGLILSTNKANMVTKRVDVTGAPNNSLAISDGGVGLFAIGYRKFTYRNYPTNTKSYTVNVRVLICNSDLTIHNINTNYFMAMVTGDGNTFLSTGGAVPNPTSNDFRYIKADEKISLKKGDYFTFVNKSDYFLGAAKDSYNDNIPSGFFFRVWAGEAGTVDVLEDFYLEDNLPEVSMIDLIKVFANIFRCGIDYNSVTNTISFFNYSFDKSTYKKLDDVMIAIKSVDRTFLDYAKKNYIKYKNEEYVTTSTAELIYNIFNDNLSEEKTLYTVPFSEGIKSDNGDVVVLDFETAEPYKKTAKLPTLAIPSMTVGENNLKHISELYNHFSIPDNLTAIIQNSTTVVCDVKMSAGDFLKIKNTDVFGYRGKKYICIAGSHSGEIADLTLVKI